MNKKVKIYISSSKGNLFISVTNLKNKVLTTCSAGRVRESKRRNRRFKKSPGAIINLAASIAKYLIKNNFKYSDIFLKITPKLLIKNFLKELNSLGIIIKKIFVRIPYTFSPVRAKKLRRI